MAEGRLEIELDGALRRVALVQDRTTLGKGRADVAIADRSVSRLHAAIERVTGGWVLQDLGSRNGTFVNGERVVGPRALRNGDEVRVGTTRMRFRAGRDRDEADVSATSPLAPPPRLTVRERDLLVALCRPLLSASLLAEPATVRDLADELVVSESGAKKLLARCYDRFDLHDDERRRGRLALEALRRGVVSVADLERG